MGVKSIKIEGINRSDQNQSKKLIIYFRIALLTVCVSFFFIIKDVCNASTGASHPYVVAHWIVPMPYNEGETSIDTIKNDIRAALEAGIDGFAINVFGGSQAAGVMSAFIKAADEIGATNFKLFLSADMSLGFPAADIVSIISRYSKNPHYLKVKGKVFLSTYGGDNLGNVWWTDNVIEPLKRLGIELFFVPYFDRGNPNYVEPTVENWRQMITKYPILDGVFNFLIPGSTPFYPNDPNIGRHWWSVLEAEENLATALHEAGKFFVSPYMPYYWAVCKPVRQYIEYLGGRGMNNIWTSIINKQKAEMVQIVTWNDYSESSYVQPTKIPLTKTNGIQSFDHIAYYELMKFYIKWYKQGNKPVITKDGIFYFYRTQSISAKILADTSACKMPITEPSQLWGLVKDNINLTLTLTSPALLTVNSGSTTTILNAPAGISHFDIPFEAGKQVFKISRENRTIIEAYGIDIDGHPTSFNLNVYSGYDMDGGISGKFWLPSDKWKRGFVADWFR